MLIDSVTSVEGLELQIRDWHFAGLKKTMGNDAYKMRSAAYERDIKEVATDVMATAYSNYERNELYRRLPGHNVSYREEMTALEGVTLVQELARKSGWKILSKGTPALGYKIEIIEM